MRIFRKILTTALSAAAMLLTLAILPASAAEVKLYDEGGRLSPSEFTECQQRLQQASDYTGMNIGVVLGVQDRSDLTIESVCKSTYLELFGANSDGLFYYMDLKGSEPYDYIATRGKGQFYYTNASSNNRVESMYDSLDDFLYPVGSENAYGAVMEFAELVEYYYDAGVPEQYFVYDDVDRMYYHMEGDEVIATVGKPYHEWLMIPVMAFFGALAGLLPALITFLVVKSRYKFKYALSPTTYVNKKNVDYHEQFDNFVRTSTSKVRIESSSGGGSGGGGGGFSSGGFGGGGHHR